MRLFFFGPRIFGLRTGVSLGREDWAKLNAQPRSASTGIDPDHSFVYVMKGDNGLCKIGRTANPNARLAQLKNEFTTGLSFAWIGAPKAEVIAIERETHKMLSQYRRNGEWFAVAPDAAVGAIHAAAFRLGQPVLDLDVAQAEQIRLIASQQQQQSRPSSASARVGVAVLQLVLGFAIALAITIFMLARIRIW